MRRYSGYRAALAGIRSLHILRGQRHPSRVIPAYRLSLLPFLSERSFRGDVGRSALMSAKRF
jgi:hypothetical protein